jgi:magnesium-transporting ATPase (P-type)
MLTRQFQITVNITAVVLTVVTAIYNSKNESVFKAVQLLWLNLIMDTFAALALYALLVFTWDFMKLINEGQPIPRHPTSSIAPQRPAVPPSSL